MAFRLALVQVVALCAARDLPTALPLDGCDWSYASGSLTVGWHRPASGTDVDAYELQISASENAEPFAVVFTEQTVLKLAFLRKTTAYWFRLRAHAAGAPSYGNGTWGGVGDGLLCRTLGAAPSAEQPHLGGKNASFFMSFIRVSPITDGYHESVPYPTADYLMNQNSADLNGAAELAAGIAFPLKDRPLDFGQSTWAQYCVELLNVTVPDTITTGDDSAFADFQSCGQGFDRSNPKCYCATVDDRRQGLDIDKLSCRMSVSGSWNESVGTWEAGQNTLLPCLGTFGAKRGCECHCSRKSKANSVKYTGKMVTPLGARYSHPKETQCSAAMAVGDTLPDGLGVCTWKLHPVARIVSGEALLKHGLSSDAPSSVAAFESALATAPLKAYACGADGANDVLPGPPKAVSGSNAALV